MEHAEEAAADHRQPVRGGPVRRAVGYTLTVLGSAVHRAVVLLVAVGLLAALKEAACWCGLVP